MLRGWGIVDMRLQRVITCLHLQAGGPGSFSIKVFRGFSGGQRLGLLGSDTLHTVLLPDPTRATMREALRADRVLRRMSIGDRRGRRHALVRVFPRAGRRQRRGRWCPTITEFDCVLYSCSYILVCSISNVREPPYRSGIGSLILYNS